jgi:hypothetical protein
MAVGMQGLQQRDVLITVKCGCGLHGQSLGFLDRPLRQEPGMHQHKFLFSVEQRLLSEPGHEVVAIRSVKNLRQRITWAKGGKPGCSRDEK